MTVTRLLELSGLLVDSVALESARFLKLSGDAGFVQVRNPEDARRLAAVLLAWADPPVVHLQDVIARGRRTWCGASGPTSVWERNVTCKACLALDKPKED